MRIIDGGFLSWMYGTTRLMHNGWLSVRSSYSARHGNLILLDSDLSSRKDLYPEYKQKRTLRRMEDPERQEKYDEVKRFKREFLEPDPSLKCFSWKGLEADDLVACIIACEMVELPLEVVGVDKDLLQLPRGTFNLALPNGSISTIERYANRLPKAIQEHVTEPRDVLLSLVLYGDKSDGIPRLLPLGVNGLAEFNKIQESPRPFTAAYEAYGRPFITNCELAVLPGPWCFYPKPCYRDMFDTLDYNVWHLHQVQKTLKEELEKVLSELSQIEVEGGVQEDDW